MKDIPLLAKAAGMIWPALLNSLDFLLKRMPAKKLLKDLYLIGAKAFPGPGVFGALQSGLFTASITLNKQWTKGKYVLNVG